MKLRDRCTQPRQVYVTKDQRNLIRRALLIAAEDGSIYGGDVPGDEGYDVTSRMIDDLEFKFRP